MMTNKPSTCLAELRKKPKQARSLARFNSILDEAEVMIAEAGCDAIVMNELARRAQVNIASIYQYFPNRAALMRQIIERYLERYRDALAQRLGALDASTSSEDLIDVIINDHREFFLEQPVFAALWAESQGDPVLKELDIQDSRFNARSIASVIAPRYPDTPAERIERMCFMLCDMSGSLMQTALMLGPDEAEMLVEEFRSMLKIYVGALGDQSLA